MPFSATPFRWIEMRTSSSRSVSSCLSLIPLRLRKENKLPVTYSYKSISYSHYVQHVKISVIILLFLELGQRIFLIDCSVNTSSCHAECLGVESRRCVPCCWCVWGKFNKQLLDEAERDTENYPDRGQCSLPKPKAEADNIDRGLDNSWYYA